MDIDGLLREFWEFTSSDQPFRQFREEEVGLELAMEVPDGEGRRSCLAKAENLSRGGIGVSISAKHADFIDLLAWGRQVSLKIHLPDAPRPLAAKAKVAWTDREKDGACVVGLQFIELSQGALGQVDEYILSHFLRRYVEGIDEAPNTDEGVSRTLCR